ncbi:MAG TPA: translation elongation factor Ts [Phycisphaerales bacterium]|nr:translation elongation factor Ts [Phycisphaerales bacterium]
MELNAKDVMKLRDKTGLPMMACKSALIEAKGDFEKAEDILRKQMKGKMDSKTSRAAGEGRIAISVAREAATIIELKAETDFTAKNEKFVNAAQKLADLAVQSHAGDVPASPAMSAVVDELRISTGENISYGRGHKLLQDPGSGAFGSYVHHDGKTGVLVQAEGSIDDETLRNVCMHIVGSPIRPMGVSIKDIPADLAEKERKFRIEQAVESGKPQQIAEKMVEGAMRKFYEERALLEQPFIRDESKKIKDLLGGKANIVAFFRWQVGEV